MAGQGSDKNVLELGEDLAVAELVRRAGSGSAPPDGMSDRVRTQVRGQWQDMLAQRQARHKGRKRFALAASALLTVAVGYLALVQQPGRAPQAVAGLQQVSGSVAIDGAGREISAEAGMSLFAGERLGTGTVGRTALLLPSGISLRLDHHTRIRLLDSEHVELERGALYVDAGPGPQSARLDVMTRMGSVRHVGTQYMVLDADQHVEILVREGKVAYSGQQGRAEAGGGQALTIAAGQDPVRSDVQVHGERWTWADELAPAFEIDGRTLDQFLAWASRQTGKTLQYSDSQTEALVQKTVLRGSVKGMPPDQALSVVMATTSLRVRRQDGVLLVYPAGSP